MKPITKLYLKTFLVMGIAYGLSMIGFDLLRGEGFSLSKFLFLTVSFGGTMSLILVSLLRHRLRKMGIQEITDDSLNVFQKKNVQSELKKSELVEKLKADPIFGKMNMMEVENGVLLTTGVSWKSWGEEIKILLKDYKETVFEYQILSSPKLKITLIDYGKNLENINRIESIMTNMA